MGRRQRQGGGHEHLIRRLPVSSAFPVRSPQAELTLHQWSRCPSCLTPFLPGLPTLALALTLCPHPSLTNTFCADRRQTQQNE